jgi:hypothetical protein
MFVVLFKFHFHTQILIALPQARWFLYIFVSLLRRGTQKHEKIKPQNFYQIFPLELVRIPVLIDEFTKRSD